MSKSEKFAQNFLIRWDISYNPYTNEGNAIYELKDQKKILEDMYVELVGKRYYVFGGHDKTFTRDDLLYREGILWHADNVRYMYNLLDLGPPKWFVAKYESKIKKVR